MPDKGDREKKLRDDVLRAARTYYEEVLVQKDPFTPGDRIPYAARVFDSREVENLVDSALDFWLTAGRFAIDFEKKLSGFLGIRHCSLVNSGSSANLLAFMSLTSQKLGDRRRIQRGDEVITVAAGFPTTVAPIIQYGAVPVFVDISLPTYNIDCGYLEDALSDRTKAVFLAHTLGNPFDIGAVKEFCDCHGLWFVEDNCDSLGAKYRLDGKWHYTGTVGHLGTSSFYPPHHITMGEGGAVYTDDDQLWRIVESLRDWGRDCWCPPGKDDTCGKRFLNKFGDLPQGYDHKYVYSHFGYNLKVTDMQAAVGCAQLEKLPHFIEKRNSNWKLLKDGMADLDEYFVLPEPTPSSEPSWFGFMLTVRPEAGFTRAEIVTFLEEKGVQTRVLFAGNLTKHPCFDEMRASKEGYRMVGDLKNTNTVMEQTFWVGVYPGLTKKMIGYMVDSIMEFCKK